MTSATIAAGDPSVAVFGDADINLIDGSSIWLISVCAVLDRLDLRGHVLLKANVTRDVLSRELEALTRIRIWQPEDVGINGRIKPSALPEALTKIDSVDRIDIVIVRGFAAASELAASGRFDGRLWPYLTDIPQAREDMTSDRIGQLRDIFDVSDRILCQTESLRSFLVLYFPDHDAKMILLPPMVPISAFSVRHNDADPGVLRLFYAGKFAPQWGIEEMFDAVEIVRSNHPDLTLTVAGDKIHDPSDDPGYRRRVELSLDSDGVVSLGGIDRNRIFDSLSDVDLALSVRHQDLDTSKEISTKLLEYAAAGVPPLVNRTLAHQELLGDDYPLFVDALDDLPGRIAEIVEEPSLLTTARSRLAEVAAPYSMEAVAQGLRPALDSSTAWSGLDLNGRRVVVAGHDLRFASELIRGFRSAGADLRLDEWRGGIRHDEELSDELVAWADTIVCEWCLANAAWYSQRKRPDQRLIVRFHRTELESQWPPLVEMESVDVMTFVGDHIRIEAAEKFGWDDQQLTVIPNFVDTVAFDRPKLPGASFTLGLLGFLPSLKRLDLALDILEELRLEDRRYRLILKGALPWELSWVWNDDSERRYFEEQFHRIRSSTLLRDAVTTDRLGGDVPSWFRKIGFVLSTSDIESFHLAMIEGMIARSIPIVFSRQGASSIVDSQWIVEDVADATRRIREIALGTDEDLGEVAHEEAIARYNTRLFSENWLRIL